MADNDSVEWQDCPRLLQPSPPSSTMLSVMMYSPELKLSASPPSHEP
jgi:hypothetical protein